MKTAWESSSTGRRDVWRRRRLVQRFFFHFPFCSLSENVRPFHPRQLLLARKVYKLSRLKRGSKKSVISRRSSRVLSIEVLQYGTPRITVKKIKTKLFLLSRESQRVFIPKRLFGWNQQLTPKQLSYKNDIRQLRRGQQKTCATFIKWA